MLTEKALFIYDSLDIKSLAVDTVEKWMALIKNKTGATTPTTSTGSGSSTKHSSEHKGESGFVSLIFCILAVTSQQPNNVDLTLRPVYRMLMFDHTKH